MQLTINQLLDCVAAASERGTLPLVSERKCDALDAS